MGARSILINRGRVQTDVREALKPLRVWCRKSGTTFCATFLKEQIPALTAKITELLADLLQFANAGDRPAITDRVRNVINDIQALACNRCVRRLVATIREQGGNYTTGIDHIPEICSRDGSNYCLPRIFWAYSRFFWRSAALPNRVLPCLGNGCDAICQAVVNTVRQTPNVGCCGRAFLGAYDTFAKRRTALANLAQCQNIGDLPEICPGRKWLANVTVSNFDCSKLDALRTNVGNAFAATWPSSLAPTSAATSPFDASTRRSRSRRAAMLPIPIRLRPAPPICPPPVLPVTPASI